jgi:hypothetical protein
MIPTRPGTTVPKPPASQVSKSKITFAPIAKAKGQRVVLYGTGGVGKTTLACLAPGPVAFIDLDESLPILQKQLQSISAPIPLNISVASWKELRASLQADGFDKVKTIVIDTATKAEELCIAETLATVRGEGGKVIHRIEDYGYGKGYQHTFDTFLPLLADLDKHVRAGRNVILVAHDCTTNVPNPNGTDYIRYEPRLQAPSSGKASIRYRMKEWADHVLFVGYDVAVDKDRKAQGSGTRTLYTSELPWFMAKSRTTGRTFDIVHGESPWEEILL